MTAFKGIWTRQFWTSMAGEFLAVFLFLVISLGSTASMNPGGNSDTHIAFCFGLSIAILIHCFGHICEAFLNPAVAVAMICTRKITVAKGLFYILIQCLGAIAATGIVALITPEEKWPVGVTKENATISHGQALLVETLITFQLVFTIFASCDKKRNDIKVPIPLIIGLSVTIGHLFAIQYTGASMNPARSLGTSLVFNHWESHWIYWIGPMMGGILAAFVYQYLFCPDPEIQLQASFKRPQNQEESVQLTVVPGGECNKLGSSDI
ncbi:PREDICTED: aquaporin-4-like [Nanorana parkeri]|uniref:aquaporin-4-like n=1 Tax=Nanorana parkeri TaxID=125878 RepID=UPI000855081A|nr:PREDICTED: aquaporin-4-like [Nanorana parkeri]